MIFIFKFHYRSTSHFYIYLSLFIFFLGCGSSTHLSNPPQKRSVSKTDHSSFATLLDLDQIFAHWRHPQVGDCLAKFIRLLKQPSFPHDATLHRKSKQEKGPFSSVPPSQSLYQCARSFHFQVHSSLRRHQLLLLNQELQTPYLNRNASFVHSFTLWKSSQDSHPFRLHQLLKALKHAFPPSSRLKIKWVKIYRFPKLSYAKALLKQSKNSKSLTFSLADIPSNLPRLSDASYLITLTLTHSLPSPQYLAWWVHIPMSSQILASLLTHSAPFFQQFTLSAPPSFIQSSSTPLSSFISSSPSSLSSAIPDPNRNQSMVNTYIFQLFKGLQSPLIFSTLSSWSHLNQWLWDRFFQKRHLSIPKNISNLISSTYQSRDTRSALPSTSYINQGLTQLHTLIQNHLHYQATSLRKYTPQTPNATWHTRRGDCKDLSNLSYHSLRSYFPLYFAFTSTSSASPLADPKSKMGDLLTLTPSLGWFNHVLIWVPSSHSKGIWFDPTQNTLQPYRLRDHWAWVMMSPTHGEWKRINLP